MPAGRGQVARWARLLLAGAGRLLGLGVGAGGLELAAGRLQVSPDEPVVLLQLLGLADEHVLGHRVELLDGLDRLAVRLDDARVDQVERAQVGRAGGPPRGAIRSAVSSTMSRTESTCGSSMVWTAMKCGPTTFQWMCLRVRARSLSAFRRSCKIVATSDASLLPKPGIP